MIPHVPFGRISIPRLFQKASTKILLYLIAMGQTVTPRSKAPRLNITLREEMRTIVSTHDVGRGSTRQDNCGKA